MKPYKQIGQSVYCGKTEVARAYYAMFPDQRRYDVRILQGMDRKSTITRIVRDCPEFAAENDIDENYYPLLFKKY